MNKHIYNHIYSLLIRVESFFEVLLFLWIEPLVWLVCSNWERVHNAPLWTTFLGRPTSPVRSGIIIIIIVPNIIIIISGGGILLDLPRDASLIQNTPVGSGSPQLAWRWTANKEQNIRRCRAFQLQTTMTHLRLEELALLSGLPVFPLSAYFVVRWNWLSVATPPYLFIVQLSANSHSNRRTHLWEELPQLGSIGIVWTQNKHNVAAVCSGSLTWTKVNIYLLPLTSRLHVSLHETTRQNFLCAHLWLAGVQTSDCSLEPLWLQVKLGFFK